MANGVQKAHRIVDLLVKELVPFYGVPECLLSDRGTNLLSHLMQDVCAALGIKKLNTTAYHPQCDGMVERFNRTLKAMVRKHAARFGKDWTGICMECCGRIGIHHMRLHTRSLLFRMDLRSPAEAKLLPVSEQQAMDPETY